MRWTVPAAIALVLAATSAVAQQPAPEVDSARAGIRTTLHSFYFSLAHHDWATLAAVILPAKVVAHRLAPAAMVAGAAGRSGSAPVAAERVSPAECKRHGPLVERAVIMLDGDWAEVSVPRCPAPAGSDEFRLIRLEARWRIVYLELYQEPVRISAEGSRQIRSTLDAEVARTSGRPPR